MASLDLAELDTVLHKLSVHALSTEIWAKKAEDAMKEANKRGLKNEELNYANKTAEKAEINNQIVEDILIQFKKAYAGLLAQNSKRIKVRPPSSRKKKTPRRP